MSQNWKNDKQTNSQMLEELAWLTFKAAFQLLKKKLIQRALR